MASETFDLFLQTGYLQNKDSGLVLPDLNEANLKNISFRKQTYQNEKLIFRIYTSNSKAQGYFETDGFVLIKIGRCYPALAFSNDSEYKSELTAEELAGLYNEQKEAIKGLIKGIFILVIYDKQSERVFALSSKSGLLRLYYHLSADALLLSTTLDTIARHPQCKTELNPVALIEQLKFGYPLGNLTLFKDIYILDNHSFLTYNCKDSSFSVRQYYSFADKLRISATLTWDETYQQTPLLFNEVMEKYISKKEVVNAALTSGFDSRSVLSATLGSKERIQYFSYGATSQSDDVRIPIHIAKKLGLNYKWIDFKNDFFEEYDYYANQLLYFTDGSGNLKRCNQMYSQSVLSENSGLCLTGCMGSELLRPNNMMNTNILPAMAKLVYSDKLDADNIADVMADCPYLIEPELYSKYKDEATEHIYEHLTTIMLFKQAYLNLYHFTIRYSLWKFFGQEFHASRIYAILISPYIDDDFVEFILKTPAPSLNKHAFQRNASDLRKGQLFYSPILKHNFPDLMNLETGRGYTPAQLESSFYPFNIAASFALRRINNTLFKKKAAFDAAEWNKISYKANPEVFTTSNKYFRELNPETVKDYEYSLKKWALEYL